MALPRTEIELRRLASPANPNEVQCVPHVVGVCSAGPTYTPRTLTKLTDLSEFGYGPGVRAAAACLARGGGPVYLTRPPTGTVSVASSASKYPATINPTLLYGGILLPGADANGEVFVTAKSSGLSVVVVDPVADGALGHTGPTGGVITITLAQAAGSLTTTATQLATYINASISTYLSAVAQGTGASLASALAQTAIENGDISYLPRQDGVRVRHVASGNNTALSVSVSTKDVTVNLATDANGTPTSTAAAVAAKLALDSAASLLLTPTASGTGAGFAGVWGYQTLTYGSTAALVVSGTPVDRGDVRIKCTRAGTIGGATTPVITWSWDGGEHVSPEAPIPASGAFILQSSKFVSGLTATFTGVLDLNDEWYFACTEPIAAQADLVTAVTAALADQTRKHGQIIVCQPVTRAQAAELDTAAQTAWATAFAGAIACVRDESAGEALSTWKDSITNDFIGLSSASGKLRMCAGYGPMVDPYTGITYMTAGSVHAGAARAASPMHFAISQVTQQTAVSNGANFIMGGPLLLLGAVYGGAQVIGGVHYKAKERGVAIQHAQQSGASKPLLVTVARTTTPSGGYRTTITVLIGTDGSSVNNSTQTEVAAAVNAVASKYVTATVVSGATVATTTAYAVEIADRQVQHDERQSEGLDTQRFITMRSHVQDPGAVYFTRDWTFAASDESGYTKMHQADVLYAVAREADAQGFRLLQSVYPTIPVAESEVVPVGALDPQAAEGMGVQLSAPIEVLLFRPKLDGRVSAVPYPAGERACTPLRNYSYKDNRELRIEVAVYLLTVADVVRLIVQPK